jgi:hypothetical protein
MGEKADRRNRVRSWLVFRVPVGLGLLMCATDQTRFGNRLYVGAWLFWLAWGIRAS